MNRLGPVMIDIEGCYLCDEDKELLMHPQVGAVILFTRNFESADQLYKLIKDIKSLRTPSLLIAVDHEGGRVQRFRNTFTVLPPIRVLGAKYDDNPSVALQHAELFGWVMASELLAFNIDFSFAPVLDVDYGVSQVIGDRAFHSNPDVIASLAEAYINGMHKAGMSATGKHFPGHGGVVADSHTDIPVDERQLDDLMVKDVVPFKHLISNHLDAIMPAHVIYNNINEIPAGFSSYWLKNILRETLNFNGVIFSDDLNMQGASYISSDYTVRAKTALEAGCDMVLVCNNRSEVKKVLGKLTNDVTEQSSLHLEKMRGRSDISWEELIESAAWKYAADVIALYK